MNRPWLLMDRGLYDVCGQVDSWRKGGEWSPCLGTLDL